MQNDTDMEKPLFVHGGLRDKSRHGVTLLRVLSRPKSASIRHRAPLVPDKEGENTQKHCIILHGWASDGDESGELWQAAKELPSSAGWHFWDATYDSHWTTFGESARQIASALNALPFDFSRSIIIGNSMGGVVARALVKEGIGCRALISVCSPHLGPAPWVPVPSRGPRSIAPWSRSLAALNRDERDRAHRDRYHFFAVTYTDILGFHPYDGIVTQKSALAEVLGPIGQRETIHLRYRGVAGYDPHWRSRFAANIAPVLQALGNAMESD